MKEMANEKSFNNKLSHVHTSPTRPYVYLSTACYSSNNADISLTIYLGLISEQAIITKIVVITFQSFCGTFN